MEGFKESQLSQSKSELTIKSYEYDLKDFFKFLDLKSDYEEIEKIPYEKMQLLINKYINKLKQNLKPKTINRRCVAINKYLKYLNIDCRAKSVKIQKKLFLNNVVTKNDVRKLLNVCSNKRDRAIIITLFGSGLRVSELLKLKVKDVNKEDIIIHGKHDKYRQVLIPIEVRIALTEYMKVRPKTTEEQLFIGKRGPIKRNTVNIILKKYAKKAKVKKQKVHPHSFRHLFCKNLADNGIGIDVIADLAGHTNVATTAIYTQRSKNELQSVLDSTFTI
ncbi:tyrosine-type recombinase/integrase [Clostridium tarantellae]|nr:tyrosine-type recombinase/integrase [Clostridium tarantellae]